MSKHLCVAPSVIPTMWLFKQKQKHVVSLHHSIHHILNHHVFIWTWNRYGQPLGSPSTCFGRHHWATQHCPNNVQVCKDGSSTRAVSHYGKHPKHIHRHSVEKINTFHRRNGLPPYGGWGAFQIQRWTFSFWSHPPCSVSARSWVWRSTMLLPVRCQTPNVSAMSTLQSPTSKV